MMQLTTPSFQVPKVQIKKKKAPSKWQSYLPQLHITQFNCDNSILIILYIFASL